MHFSVFSLFLSAALTNKVTNGLLESYFTKYGDVENCRIHSKPTGFKYAFITFKTTAAAAKALASMNHRISDRQIKVTVADSWHQSDGQAPQLLHSRSISGPSTSTETGIELENQTGTNLMDVNDDCLIEILSKLSINDLCSVAETCVRLRKCAGHVFSKSLMNEVWSSLDWNTLQQARRYLVIFGPCMSTLETNGIRDDMKAFNRRLDLLLRYCDGTLEKMVMFCHEVNKAIAFKLQALFANLKKITLDSCTFLKSAESVNLFVKCKRLEKLKINEVDGHFNSNLFQMTIPTLKALKIRRHTIEKTFSPDLLCSFIARHPHLKKFHLRKFVIDCNVLCDEIAKNVTELENLCIQCQSFGLSTKFFSTKLYAERLVTLEHLKKLVLYCEQKSITPFLIESKSTSTLETLQLYNSIVDDDFYYGLSKCQNIRKLTLINMKFESDIQGLAVLSKLTDLTIKGNVAIFNPRSNDTAKAAITSEYLIELVKKMPKLQKISLRSTNYILDDDTYKKLVQIVAEQSNRPPLEITNKRYHCIDNEIPAQNDGNNISFVKYKCNSDLYSDEELSNFEDVCDDDDIYDYYDSDDSYEFEQPPKEYVFEDSSDYSEDYY